MRYNPKNQHPKQMKYRKEVPPVLTYSSNRPLDLQEKVITMMKKSVNQSAKNLQELVAASHALPRRESTSRNLPATLVRAEYATTPAKQSATVA